MAGHASVRQSSSLGMRPSARFASALLTARNWRGEAFGPSVVSASEPLTVRNWGGEVVRPSAMIASALLTVGSGEIEWPIDRPPC